MILCPAANLIPQLIIHRHRRSNRNRYRRIFSVKHIFINLSYFTNEVHVPMFMHYCKCL